MPPAATLGHGFPASATTRGGHKLVATTATETAAIIPRLEAGSVFQSALTVVVALLTLLGTPSEIRRHALRLLTTREGYGLLEAGCEVALADFLIQLRNQPLLAFVEALGLQCRHDAVVSVDRRVDRLTAPGADGLHGSTLLVVRSRERGEVAALPLAAIPLLRQEATDTRRRLLRALDEGIPVGFEATTRRVGVALFELDDRLLDFEQGHIDLTAEPLTQLLLVTARAHPHVRRGLEALGCRFQSSHLRIAKRDILVIAQRMANPLRLGLDGRCRNRAPYQPRLRVLGGDVASARFVRLRREIRLEIDALARRQLDLTN